MNYSYKEFEEDVLPQNAVDFLKVDEYWDGCWYAAYYRGDIETTDDWIIVVDTGCFYKVNATFMTWYKPTDKLTNSEKDKPYGKCNWSSIELKKTIHALRQGKTPPIDIDYHT